MVKDKQEPAPAGARWGTWLLIAFLAVAGVAMLLVDLVYEKHVYFPFEGWFGFYAFYGFGACLLLSPLARLLRWLVRRPEGYYRERPDDR